MEGEISGHQTEAGDPNGRRLATASYYASGPGISVGPHRYCTHGSFKAIGGLKRALAVAGSLAIEGPVITWVADHRKHHKYTR